MLKIGASFFFYTQIIPFLNIYFRIENKTIAEEIRKAKEKKEKSKMK